MSYKFTFKHWLAHLTHWNGCRAVSEYDEDGNLWLASECVTCGHIANKFIKHPDIDL